MGNKKILVFNLTPRSGMLHYSSQFCNELVKKNNVFVCLASYYNGNIYNDSIELIKIRTNPNIYSFIFDSLLIGNHIILLYKINKIKPDIIHFMDNHPWYIVYSKLFKSLGYTIYTTQHNPIQHSGENKGLLGKITIYVNKILRNISDKLIVNGDVLKKDLIEVYGINKEKIISVPHGDYNFLLKYKKNIPIIKNSFLFFGRIEDYKGLDILLNSLEYIKKEIIDFKLIIAGPGNIATYKEKIQKNIDNIEIYNTFIEQEEISSFFEKIEFVVLPYKDATGSGVLAIAFAFEKASILSDVGELATNITDDETGIIIDPNNPKQLAEKIIYLLKNKEKTELMGKKSKEFSDKNLGWPQIVNKIYN